MGMPPTNERGEDMTNTAPVMATTATAALMEQSKKDRAAYAWAEDRLPRSVAPSDQALSTGGDPRDYGEVGAAGTAQIPARSSAALMNASRARRTG
jgi:hypothetical protein